MATMRCCERSAEAGLAIEQQQSLAGAQARAQAQAIAVGDRARLIGLGLRRGLLQATVAHAAGCEVGHGSVHGHSPVTSGRGKVGARLPTRPLDAGSGGVDTEVVGFGLAVSKRSARL